MQTREEIEARITEAFLGFQRGKSREAMISNLANDIESAIKEADGKAPFGTELQQSGDNKVAMKRKGYFGIGCLNMKTSMNFGTLFRTAQIFGADFIFLIGCRFNDQLTDTMKSWKHIPTFIYKDFADFNNHRPHDCKLIGIELIETATPLKQFKHPKQACYLLGAEDNGLTREAIINCQEIIYLPGEHSLNVSVAGSIVLYDRVSKCL